MSDGLNILLITARRPHPPTAGDRQRTNLLYRALAKVGHVETLMLLSADQVDEAERLELEARFNVVGWLRPRRHGQVGGWRLIRPLHPQWVDRIAHNLGRTAVEYAADPHAAAWLSRRMQQQRYDLIVARYLPAAAKSGALQADVPVIVDVDDLDTQVYRTRLEVPGLAGWRRRVVLRHLRQLEAIVPPLLKRAAHLWLVSELDRPLVDHTSVSVLPNIPFVAEDVQAALPVCRETPTDSRSVLMVGSLTHRVNRDGLDRFVDRAWPQIHRRCPDAAFRIVGSGMTRALAQRYATTAGVEPVGFVDDVAQAYAQCAFAVSPLFEGGGTKIKVLESFMHGRTGVVTQHALRGYEHVLKHRESVWQADDEGGLVAGCVALLNDAAMRQQMAARGRQVVQHHFSFDVFRRVVAQTVAQVVG